MIPGNPAAVVAEHLPAATWILYNRCSAFRAETVGNRVQKFMYALAFIHVVAIHWPPPFCLPNCSCPVETPRFHTGNLKKVRNFHELYLSFTTAQQPAFRRKLQACHFAKRPVFSGVFMLFPCSTGHICCAVHIPSECSRTPSPAISRILTREGAAVSRRKLYRDPDLPPGASKSFNSHTHFLSGPTVTVTKFH